MRKTRWIKLLMALAVSVVMLCTQTVLPQIAAAQEIMLQYEHYDMTQLDGLLSEFESKLQSGGNDEQIKYYYNELLKEYNKIDTDYVLSYINYVADMTDENYKEYSYMNETCKEGNNKIFNAINKAIKSRYYHEFIVGLLGDYYKPVKESDLNDDDEKISNIINEIEHRYMDIAYSKELSIDDKNLKCAELYLELAKKLNSITGNYGENYFDYSYKNVYSRDYTVDDIIQVGNVIKSETNDSFKKVYDLYQKAGNKISYRNEDLLFENNFEIINRYADRISSELKESSDFILANSLYRFGETDNSMKGAFTTELPQYENTAFIYQYLYRKGEIDLTSSIHEFGHFNSIRHNSIPNLFVHVANIDIAEVQSQGLEVLFTEFYDEIFGENIAELVKIWCFNGMLETIKTGFMVNEYEYYIFHNAENMSPEDAVNKYTTLANEYGINDPVDMYNIRHIYKTPGYYISYATSALACIELWEVMCEDFDKAVQMYTEISHYNIRSGDVTFVNSLESSGFKSVVSSEYISGLGDVIDTILAGKSNNAEPFIIPGDIDDNGIISVVDLTKLQLIILSMKTDFSDKEIQRYDLDGNGRINIADVTAMCRLLLEDL